MQPGCKLAERRQTLRRAAIDEATRRRDDEDRTVAYRDAGLEAEAGWSAPENEAEDPDAIAADRPWRVCDQAIDRCWRDGAEAGGRDEIGSG